MQSSLSRIDRTVRTFSCKLLKIEGESRRIVIASDAATERAAGMAAEKTKEVPLIRWKGVSETEEYEYEQEVHLMLDDNGRSGAEATCGAETGGDRSDQHIDLGSGDIVKLGETTTGSSNSPEREAFIENETVLVLVLELDLWHSLS